MNAEGLERMDTIALGQAGMQFTRAVIFICRGPADSHEPILVGGYGLAGEDWYRLIVTGAAHEVQAIRDDRPMTGAGPRLRPADDDGPDIDIRHPESGIRGRDVFDCSGCAERAVVHRGRLFPYLDKVIGAVSTPVVELPLSFLHDRSLAKSLDEPSA